MALFAAPAAFACHPAQPGQFTRTETTIPMDDGVALAATLYEPLDYLRCDHQPVAAPAVLMFHGIGESRTKENAVGPSLNAVAEQYLANHGYLVLTVDLRGHGESGGRFSANGPRELEDVRRLFEWLAARPDVDRNRIGLSGYSLGGGLVWRAAVAGIPFAAIETLVTWTDLESALAPQGLAKHGLIFRFVNSVARERTAPEVLAATETALRGDVASIRAFARERSTRDALDRVRAPVLIMQGRRDFAFDLTHAIDAFSRLRVPKRLYLADFGHAPSPKPPAELPHALEQGRLWFDRFLKRVPNGIDMRPPVELASDPWTGKTTEYAGLPPTRALSVSFPGTKTIGARGKVVRTIALPRAPLETFGAPVVRVQASTTTRWPRLVAVLSALTPSGDEIVVSAGGAATTISRRTRTISLRLISVATFIPAGSRLRVTLASASTAQNPGNLLYLDLPMPARARVTIGKVAVSVPVLRTPVSGAASLRRYVAGGTPGVTPTTVLLGGTAPFSGPESAYAPTARGAEAYFKYVNSRGGVHGRRILYKVVDDGYDPGRTVQATRELVQNDGVFAIFNSIGTEHNLAIRPFLNQLRIPQLFVGSGASAIAGEYRRYPWTMGYGPSFVGEGTIYGRYVARTAPRARIAVLHEDSVYGEEVFRGLRRGLGRKVGQIVETATYEVTDVDLTSQIAKLKASGADTLMLFALPKQTIQAFVAAHRLGWRPRVFLTWVSTDPAVMRIARLNSSDRATEGTISVAFLKDASNPTLARDPGVQLYKRVMRRFLPGANPDEVTHLYGMAAAFTMVDALKRAGRNLTRERLLRAATSLNEKDNPFVADGVTIRTSPTNYFTVATVKLYRYTRGRWQPFGRLISARG